MPTAATVDFDEAVPRCDVCNAQDEEVVWCGECGNCAEHCAEEEDCPPRGRDEFGQLVEL